MEKSFTRSPQFWVFSSHILSQSPQNFQVKFLIDTFSRRNEFPLHDSLNIEKKEHLFTFELTCLAFFGLGELGVFHWLEVPFVSGSYP